MNKELIDKIITYNYNEFGNEFGDCIVDMKNEIERLNNIINGMEKFFKYAYDNEIKSLNDRKISVWTICLDKLQELKGDSSNGKTFENNG